MLAPLNSILGIPTQMSKVEVIKSYNAFAACLIAGGLLPAVAGTALILINSSMHQRPGDPPTLLASGAALSAMGLSSISLGTSFLCASVRQLGNIVRDDQLRQEPQVSRSVELSFVDRSGESLARTGSRNSAYSSPV